jgi:hypothetical protein
MLTYVICSSNRDAIEIEPFLALCVREDKNPLLHPLHLTGVSPFSIIETVQVQKPMHNVQAKLACERISESASVTARCFNTDKDFAMLKSQHVRRTCFMEELPMQRRHSTIRDKPDKDFTQRREVCRFPLAQSETCSQRFRREFFETANANRNRSLAIAHADLWSLDGAEISLCSGGL